MFEKTENWQQNAVDLTIDSIEDFMPINKPFFWNSESPARKVFIKEPLVYYEYRNMDKTNRERAYKKLIKENEDFRRYVEAVRLMELENESNKQHLENMINLCNELGQSYEKQCLKMIEVRNLYT